MSAYSEAPDVPHEYRSAIGWDPNAKVREKFAKEIARHRKKDTTIRPWNSMVEVRDADDVMRRDIARETQLADRPRADLFGTLWQTGELAVLAGETGVGKSILAVQIANAIANARRFEPFRRPPRRAVVYVDLERSAEQFRERYTVLDQKNKPVRHRFGPNFKYASIRPPEDYEVPPAFENNLNELLIRSIGEKVLDGDAPIVIIDNISYLASGRTARSIDRIMKMLHFWTRHEGLSILAIAHLKPKRGRRGSTRSSLTTHHSPLGLSDISGSAAIAQIADSVFALGPSTMSEDIRYIKPLKSNSTQPLLPPNQVLTYRLGRMENGKVKMENADPAGTPASSPPARAVADRQRNTGGILTPERVASASDDEVVGVPAHAEGVEPSENFLVSANSPLSIINSQLNAAPFLGVEFLGFSAEQDHLIDYTAAALARETDREASRLKKLRSGSVVDMILSPEYQRYLKGE